MRSREGIVKSSRNFEGFPGPPQCGFAAKRLQSFKGFEHLLRRFEPPKPVLPPVFKPPEKQKYTCDELQQFIRFFPSHFTLGLPGSALRYRHILDEVMLELHVIPAKLRIPHYNLLGFLFACQGNYNYAFRYFHEVLMIQENNIISIANQAHCYLRQNCPERAHESLRKLINLTSSADFMQVTKESYYMSEAKTNLGYAYHVFGLNNAAKRMYESAMKYNDTNVNANYGLAATLITISYHENRSRRDFFLQHAGNLLSVVLTSEPGFLPASIMLLRVRAENPSLPSLQLDVHIRALLKEHQSAVNARVLRDLARIKMDRKEFEGELGTIDLLEQSLEKGPTADAYHLLGKAHYLKWYKDAQKRRRYVKKSLSLAIKSAGMELSQLPEEEEIGTAVESENGPGAGILKNNAMEEPEMLKFVKSYFEKAAKKSYNSDLETLLELGVVCGKLGEFQRSRDLLRRAVQSEDTSIQERGYRHLAIFDQGGDMVLSENYLREAMCRQHFVRLTEGEREEFWERVFLHAEESLSQRGHQAAFPWIRDLVEARFPRTDLLVELYNREAPQPMSGLNGEIPNTKKLSNRKLSKSRMI